MSPKPIGCRFCEFNNGGFGFCPDEQGASAKLTILLKHPGKEEVVEGRPMVGRAGRYWVHTLLEPLGLSRADVLIANVLRCCPRGSYPTGELRKKAEKTCREYDTALRAFGINLFVSTYHPAAALRDPMLTRIIRREVEKALGFSAGGWRPCLLMGEEALHLVAPDLVGGMRLWHGHYWEGTWNL